MKPAALIALTACIELLERFASDGVCASPSPADDPTVVLSDLAKAMGLANPSLIVPALMKEANAAMPAPRRSKGLKHDHDAILGAWQAHERASTLCARLGITPKMMKQIVGRARKRGDPRAVKRGLHPEDREAARVRASLLIKRGKTKALALDRADSGPEAGVEQDFDA